MKTTSSEALIVAARLRGETEPILNSLLALYRQGIRSINVTFNGGEDSGDISYIEYRDAKGEQVKGPGRQWDSEAQKPVDVPGDIEVPETFDEELYRLIENNVDHDWVNNEGGGGTLDIDLETLDVDISSYWNETVQRESDGVSYNLLGEEH